MECGFEKFADFILRRDKFKKNFVKAEVNKTEYRPEEDFYLKLRTRLKKILRHNLSLNELDELLETISPKKIKCYEESILCIKEFLKDKVCLWEPISKSEIEYGGLKIVVNPHIGLKINGILYLIRVHFKKDAIKPHKIEILQKIMQNAYKNDLENVKLAIWDIRSCKFYAIDLNEEIRINYDFEKSAEKWIEYAKENDF